jgi:ribonuclease HI
MNIHIYTDGGCSGNPGPGGWAYVILRIEAGKPELIEEKCGGSRDTTNNRMELSAALLALERALELDLGASRVTLHTDSQYVQKGMTEWLENWKRKNWRTSAKEPVKNQDLWQRLDVAASALPIQWKWVKGHAGDLYNERCDELTQYAIAKLGKRRS